MEKSGRNSTGITGHKNSNLMDWSSRRTDLVVLFDKVVEQTVTDWQITPVTPLTRFGGTIGVVKNLL